MNEPTREVNTSRREFLTRSSLAVTGAAAVAQLPFVHTAYGAEDLQIKIGLIGCGGRGTGAALDALGAATKVIYPQLGYHTENVAEGTKVEKKHVRVVGLADLFPDRLDTCRGQLAKLGIDIPRKTCFTGWEAYQQLLAVEEINYVILATPPHFRPQQAMAAVEAGKHVFIEKPAAVDAPGVKRIMKAGELAREKGLGIAAGTQRRHRRSYQETIRKIQEGAIGDILYAKCYWNGGQIWVVDRQEGWSDMEWQLRNWNYFTWLSGDHIVEQHVHNLDIMNWVLGSHPVKAVSGLGGRQVRVGDRHGHVFDHFPVEYQYPNGVAVFRQCRQL
ncbi:MAG: Gfo/Idh/MocA family protein, partial [Pirellulaceae bacterium]